MDFINGGVVIRSWRLESIVDRVVKIDAFVLTSLSFDF